MNECTERKEDSEHYSINPELPTIEKNKNNEKNEKKNSSFPSPSPSPSWYDIVFSALRSDFTAALKFLIIYLSYSTFSTWALACIGVIIEQHSKYTDDIFFKPIFITAATIFFSMAFLIGDFIIKRIIHTINQLYKWRFNLRFKRDTCTNIDDMMNAVETIFNLHKTQLDNDGKRNIETYKLLIPFIQANGWLDRDI